MKWILISLVVIFSQTVETTTGFGSTVISLSIGSTIIPLKELVVSLVFIGWLQSVWIVMRDFKNIQWGLLFKRILLFSGLGFPFGIYFFHYFKTEELKVILGAFIVVISLAELFNLTFRKGLTRELPLYLGIIFLLLGGFIHGIFATGGPLIVYYATREIKDKTSFRATLSMLWLLLNSILTINFYLTHNIKIENLKLTAILLPSLVLGIIFGEIMHKRINEYFFKILVQIILLITGIVLLVSFTGIGLLVSL